MSCMLRGARLSPFLAPQIISRKDALALGLRRYYTGKPCKHGHVTERYTRKSTCVACAQEEGRERYALNPEFFKEKARRWAETNPERSKENAKKWQEANSAAVRKYKIKWRDANRDKRREDARKRRLANPAKKREESRKWREANPGYMTQYSRIRRVTDPQYAIATRLRSRLNNALRAAISPKHVSAVRDCGLAPTELVAYLESKFLPDMTWDNRSAWHIDHIRPLSSFDLTDPAQQREACHFSNLQPLWGEDNLSKGAQWSD